MSAQKKQHLIHKVHSVLNKKFPLRLADTSWDNVGTLVENPKPNGTNKILVTIDLTPAVMEECLQKNVEVIIAYHPPIFMPMKKLVVQNPKQNIILECIANGMSIYSPHTSFDAAAGGINDWLIDLMIAGKEDGSSSSSSWSKKPIQPSSPADFAAVTNGNPKDLPVNTGYGRVATTKTGVSLADVIPKLKAGLNIPTLRVALPGGSHKSAGGIEAAKDITISSIAVCAGSGGSVFKGLKNPVDLVVTGELSHHEVLALNDQGSVVVLAEHTNTERGFLTDVLVPFLSAAEGEEGNVGVAPSDIMTTNVDADPLFIW